METARHDPFSTQHEARRPATEARPHVADRLREPTGRHIRPRELLYRWHLRDRALDRQAVRAPVSLSRRVLVYVREAESLEPPRGPWAHVSLEIVAVDDDRAILREP